MHRFIRQGNAKQQTSIAFELENTAAAKRRGLFLKLGRPQICQKLHWITTQISYPNIRNPSCIYTWTSKVSYGHTRNGSVTGFEAEPSWPCKKGYCHLGRGGTQM